MLVQVDLSVLKETRWYQVAVRFFLGGLVTAATGLIAKKYGPGVGGLFLAFPAILPASATLIEKHERERKEEAGVNGSVRARKAVGLDAAGAAMGSIGLFVFAWLITEFVPRHQPYMVLVDATMGWMIVSLLIWYVRKRT